MTMVNRVDDGVHQGAWWCKSSSKERAKTQTIIFFGGRQGFGGKRFDVPVPSQPEWIRDHWKIENKKIIGLL